MIICENCRCFHPVTVSDRYCGECCIGDTRNPIAINADITGCCLFEPKQPKKPKPMTNADQIRQMTDEELADFFCQISQCCANDASCSMCPIYDGCAQNVMYVEMWLKQEVSEDAAD